jgi:ectoine hydroxylase-related dioxygenase (phytanoyl-CoA dioxygenase family)
VLALLEALYGRRPRPFTTLNFQVGTEQAPHSDTIHFNSDPPGFMCGVWVALEDVDDDNGPLVYYPGSHTLPEYTMQDAGLSPSAADYPRYETFIRGVIERSKIAPRYGTVSKGQAIVWASNLLHGGSPRRDRNRTRHSQVTHYFFEDVRTLTPMLSTPDAPCVSDPHWIV